MLPTTDGLIPACHRLTGAIAAWTRLQAARRARFRPATGPSTTTLAQYRAVFARFERQRQAVGTSPSCCAAASGKRSCWWTLRYSYTYCAGQRMREGTTQIAKALERAGVALDGALAAELVALLDEMLGLLGAVYSFEIGMPPRRRRAARKTCVQGLPCDWRERLAAILPAPVRRAYLVAALTGARPAELARGIDVRLARDGGREVLFFSIPGAKVTASSGQPLRSLSWPVHCNALTTLLCNEMEDLPPRPDGSVSLRTCLSADLSAYVRRYARSLWPEHRLSTYALRYQFALELEDAGLDRAQIAQALGHCTESSQCRYRPCQRTRPRPRGPALELTHIAASRGVRGRARDHDRGIEREYQSEP
jgi:hypothetical protein